MHLTLGIYPNGDYKYNVVADEHLEEHIEYNKIFRPGRIFYVDGERINNGMMKEELLPEYDKIAKEFFEKNKVDKFKSPTIPYR